MSADRLSGRSTDRGAFRHPSGPGQRPNGSDLSDGSIAATKRRNGSGYVTAARLAAIVETLTPTDWRLLETVQRFHFMTGQQLGAMSFGRSESAQRAARRMLVRLTKDQVLDRLERRIGGVRAGSSGYVYRLGLAGARLLGVRHGGDEPGLHHLHHALAVADVFVQLKAQERTGLVVIEYWDGEPACWRNYTGKHGDRATLKPDGFAALRINGRGRRWFIEVDRGSVSTATLKHKMRQYADYFETGEEQTKQRGVFPRVVWVCTSERRAKHVLELGQEENERVGGELHRLLGSEWQPPPNPHEASREQRKEEEHD